ncbi:peptidase U32 family protein [Spirochaeta cellobiosiphila]|uniref:peptidase U32 family protein n=1 Tax=Spirochaeta cellobiosiphila TaxID=504483 RepID=UPI000420FF07|nr:DUF3656 domain-containing protein [Spirochaeta cellobiosiphila]
MGTELLSPAGSFNTAIYAVQGGADALYLGLKQFSARQKAENFTLEQVRRLKTANKGTSLYLAINTIHSNEDLQNLTELLPQITKLPIEACIIQDWGVYHLLKKNYPHLPLHGSTQMAVHNVNGAQFLYENGFTRAVLARELKISEIKRIKEAVPELELEVFIHGAYCYGFSGLCLASGLLIHRSGNKGQCGQICRTWFNDDHKKKAYHFSGRDIFYGKKIQELVQIGVTSLKIEGRMKSPQYAYHSAAYYRNLLDDKLEEAQNHEEELRLSFQRSTMGTLKTTPENPGHEGLPCAVITKKTPNGYQYKRLKQFKNHDGLMFLDKQYSPPKRVGFAAQLDKSGKLISDINIPIDTLLYHISPQNRAVKEYKDHSYKVYKTEIEADITLEQEDLLTIKTDSFAWQTPISREDARGTQGLADVIAEQFSKSGTSFYTLKPSTIDPQFNKLFIPPKDLKRIKNSFYEYIESYYLKEGEKLRASLTNRALPPQELYTTRARMVDPQTELPFYVDLNNVTEDSMYQEDGRYYLPLAPVIWNSSLYFNHLENFISTLKAPIVLGLSNPAHLHWAVHNKERNNIFFFIDYGLYAANSESLSFFEDLLGDKLLFILPYIELNPSPFNPPLFISRVCQIKENHQGACPQSCPRKGKKGYTQQGKQFTLVIQDCINYLFSEKNN